MTGALKGLPVSKLVQESMLVTRGNNPLASQLLIKYGRTQPFWPKWLTFWQRTPEIQDYFTKYGYPLLEPYSEGRLTAFHYPAALVSPKVAERLPGQLLVQAVSYESSPTYLRSRISGPTVLLCFSNHPLSGLFTGVEEWKRQVLSEFSGELPVLSLNFDNSWMSRRFFGITRMALRTQLDIPGQKNTLMFRQKVTPELLRICHLYEEGLPTLLVVDGQGFIRWHAVGLPCESTNSILRNVLKGLLRKPNL